MQFNNRTVYSVISPLSLTIYPKAILKILSCGAEIKNEYQSTKNTKKTSYIFRRT